MKLSALPWIFEHLIQICTYNIKRLFVLKNKKGHENRREVFVEHLFHTLKV